jgi:rod shape determining protein RodA
MRRVLTVFKREPALVVGAVGLVTIGLLTLRSIAPDIFPTYYIYIVLGMTAFLVFSQIDFDILSLFSKHLYVFSIFLLLLPLVIGEVTRGATRWIQIGQFSIQPTELVRPFLILFFANLLVDRGLTIKVLAQAFALLLIPVVLILLQPSLGVAALTLAGFAGVGLSLKYNKKMLLFIVATAVAVSPFLWLILAPYQKARVMALVSPVADPTGAGYNSIQSMIAVGSGMISGRGLGEGVQTQLAFLPERQTDFIFASIAEELGFVGAGLVIGLSFFVLYRIVVIVENAGSPVARAFAAGVFTTFFVQILIHIGMNMGLLPITGQPLPLISAGGSSLVATMATFGMLVQVKR